MSAPPEQFWLLTGEVPTGPLTVAQIHDKLATGEATWQTPACPVGGSNWRPIIRTPGLGPDAGGTTAPASEPTASAAPKSLPPLQKPATDPPAPGRVIPPPLPSTSSPPGAPAVSPEGAPADPKSERIGAAIGIGIVLLLIAGGVYGVSWVWEQIRPLIATEVCKKLDDAKTATEAKKYVTTRLHAYIDAEYAKKSALDPNIEFAFTQEIDGPQPGTKLVGFRGTFFVQEAGQRVQIEGHCKVVKADGWKVDDLIVTGVEGTSLPGPVSLVDEHRASLTQPKLPTPGPALPGAKVRPFVPSQSSPPIRSEWPRQKHPIEKAFLSLKDAVGWGGIVAIVILLVACVAIRESLRKKSPPT